MVKRGVIAPPEQLELCQSAQLEFDTFCAMHLVPTSQLYGGKVCAALDRQHPRDFFDLSPLMDQDGFFNDIKHGFLYSLLCSDRPMYELLAPRPQDKEISLRTNLKACHANLFPTRNTKKLEIN